MTTPSSYTALISKPISEALTPNRVNRSARSSDISSPVFATSVSLTTQIFPASIRVLIERPPNLLIIGPGLNPVFPEGITISSRAKSPGLAKTLTLFLCKVIAKWKGFPLLKI